MAIARLDFWKLLIQSRLFTQEQCQHLSAQFANTPGGREEAAKPLAEWLVRQRILSKYQALILLAGRAGPFFYGDYKVYDRIDGGRLGGFFRAVHAETNHPVLLKFLASQAAQTPAGWAELLRWIPYTTHPQIVRCYEAVDLTSYKFLVFEDLRGQSLADVLERNGRIPPDEASRLTRLAALALAALHDQSRTHGDVRPHNLWLDPNGNLKLLVEPDVGTRTFSVAQAASEPDGLVRADYAAPEYLQAGRPADPLIDIYALGCTLYQLVSGQAPFSGGDVPRKLQRHATEAIQRLESAGVSPPLEQLIAYLMAKNPAVRYQQLHVVAEQLVQFVGAAQQNLRATAPLTTAAPYEMWLQQQASRGPHVARPASAVPQFGPAATAPVHPAVAMAGVVGPAYGQPGAVPVVGPVAVDNPGGVQLGGAATAVAAAIGAAQPAPAIAVGPAAAGPVVASKTTNAAVAIRKRAAARRRNNVIFLAISLVAVIGAVTLGVMMLNRSPQVVTQQDQPGVQPGLAPVPASGEGAPSPGEASPSEAAAPPDSGRSTPTATGSGPATATLAEDNGQLLWASPTSGAPIEFKYVPAGGQLFVVVRPADILSSEEGQRVVKSLGPEFTTARTAWENRSGVQLEEVEQLTLALYSNNGQTPKVACVVRGKQEFNPESLRAKWTGAAPVDNLTGVYRQGESAFYLPPDDKQTFVMGPFEPEIRAAAEGGWKAPLLRREIGQLLQASDSQRHMTLLFAPNFLFGDGQDLFAGQRIRVKQPLLWFLGDGLKAGFVSMHFADNFYFEMRMESDIQLAPFQLATQVRERIEEIPESIELHIASLNPHPYWRLVANRYPSMVRFLHQQARIGVEGNHAVVNAVLPGVAAHNLVFGGEMLLASAPGAAIASAGASPASQAPQNVQEALNAKISIAFDQDSLEFAMQNVAKEVGSTFPGLPFEFKIKILGPDLEKDGITRNQQVREFNQKDQRVADVLTAMVRKANPVTTVKEPHELDQKLIWVVGPDPDNPATQIVLVTTRNGADQKKYTLPDVFRPK